MVTKFTWRGPKWINHDNVFKKLGRVLYNIVWHLKYHEGFVNVIPQVQFEHPPLMLLFGGGPYNGGTTRSSLKLHGYPKLIFLD